MENPYKLHIKLGDAEFSAEGPESTVKEAYSQFLEAVKTVGAKPASKAAKNAGEGSLGSGLGLPESVLEHAFQRDGEYVTLRHLPPAESPNRTADSVILLLYGYKVLAQVEDVPVIKLNESLRKSGVSVERLDRYMGTHGHLYRKGGTRSGGRYTLNNQGLAQAEHWLAAWFQ
jgi:hypothetical protein